MRNSTILDIINSICEAFEADGGLVSLTLHGSYTDKDWKDKSYIDCDILFVYKDEEFSDGLERVRSFFETVKNYDNEGEVFVYSLKSGPMHPLRKAISGELIDLNNSGLCFFHVSVFSESTYKGDDPGKSPSKLLINTWQQRKSTLGSDLKELKCIEKLSIDDVLDSKLGIRDCIKMLSSKKKGYWDYTDSNEMLWCSEDFSDFDAYEFCVYSIKWAIYNSIAALMEYVPLNINENSLSDLFKKQLLPRNKYAEFEELLDFGKNIQSYREQYVQAPANFTTKYSEATLLDAAVNILIDVEKNLTSILAYEEKIHVFPYEGKDIQIYVSVNMKHRLLEKVNGISPDKLFVIYDSNARKEYDLSSWIDNIQIVEYIVSDSSKEKSLGTLTHLLNYAEESLIIASSLVIIVGGGNVGNLGGMASGLLLRGIQFIHLPTTVLAQLDSSIGAKQSVNGRLSKNKFGLFHPPNSILVNPLFIKTLSEIHIKSGLIESVKHGFCQSSDLVDAVTKFDLSSNNVVELGDLIHQTIKLKLEYMLSDPYENSPEQHLELGHKVGHSLEHLTNEAIPHGICVAFGMVAESCAFFNLGLIKQHVLEKIVTNLKLVVDEIDLPSSVTDVDIAKGMFMDNKRHYDIIPFVLLKEFQSPESYKFTVCKDFVNHFVKGILFAREVFCS